ERGTAFYGGAHCSQALLKSHVFLVPGKNFQALHQRQSGINHHRKLTEENGNIFGGHFAGTESRQVEFFALLFYGFGGNALPAQKILQMGLIVGFSLPGDRLTLRVGSLVCKYRHIENSSRSLWLQSDDRFSISHYFRAGAPTALGAITPRLIMSCNPSGNDDRDKAT